jgi:hypothetical protein
MSLSKNENEFDGIPNPEEQGFVEDETEDAAVSRTLEWWYAIQGSFKWPLTLLMISPSARQASSTP